MIGKNGHKIKKFAEILQVHENVDTFKIETILFSQEKIIKHEPLKNIFQFYYRVCLCSLTLIGYNNSKKCKYLSIRISSNLNKSFELPRKITTV